MKISISGYVQKALKRFLGTQIPDRVYADGAGENRKAVEGLGIPFDSSTPCRSQSNGVAERAVRKVEEGTACVLAQSGFDMSWWPEASRCYCFLHCVSTIQSNGSTAYETRFGAPFAGPRYRFGCAVNYRPSNEEDQHRLHSFEGRMLPGLFVGYYQEVGGGWNGNLFVVDVEKLMKHHHPSHVPVARVKWKEVIPVKGDHFVFPFASGHITQPRIPRPDAASSSSRGSSWSEQ